MASEIKFSGAFRPNDGELKRKGAENCLTLQGGGLPYVALLAWKFQEHGRPGLLYAGEIFNHEGTKARRNANRSIAQPGRCVPLAFLHGLSGFDGECRRRGFCPGASEDPE